MYMIQLEETFMFTNTLKCRFVLRYYTIISADTKAVIYSSSTVLFKGLYGHCIIFAKTFPT